LVRYWRFYYYQRIAGDIAAQRKQGSSPSRFVALIERVELGGPIVNSSSQVNRVRCGKSRETIYGPLPLVVIWELLAELHDPIICRSSLTICPLK